MPERRTERRKYIMLLILKRKVVGGQELAGDQHTRYCVGFLASVELYIRDDDTEVDANKTTESCER